MTTPSNTAPSSSEATHASFSLPRDLSAPEFQARLKRLAAFQKRLRLDAVLIVSQTNLYYFTSLHTSNGLLLSLLAETPAFYTDFRYLAMARRKTPWLSCGTLWRPADEQLVLEEFGKSWRRIGYEGPMETSRFLRWQAACPHAAWIDIQGEIAQLRAVKSPAEQRVMRATLAANDRLLSAVLSQTSPGMTEWQIRSLVRQEADRLGQGEAFESVVCVGRNAAECHHTPDGTRLRRGQPLLLDIGLKRDHYCADLTRCAFFGKPPPHYRELFNLVRTANRQAIRAIRPGARCCDIDKAARDLIAQAGYGPAFGHSLGHSLGLEVHEAPSFSPACATPLKPGMVLTVEPGIYLPGKLGIRIEDVILVTRTGCEVLTQSPHVLSPG